jgi:hypothetical protein
VGNVAQVTTAIEALEAERVVETVQLRSELVKAARELLPEAIKQAKPHGEGKHRTPGNASLLRLISRIAMRDVRIDRRKK